ncbi:MAG: hypothetical protein DHS20C17_27920 [Cyclobacteriaceae bacterium]|nr:MAG: hypothetical protein DHS20C17_27920 [Cyclobacteriaceae bacterium]
MNREMKVLSGFVLGAIAGGAAGLLLAPASGKRTRKKLKRESQRMVNEAKNTLADVANEAAVKVNEGLEDFSVKGRDSITKLREKISN